MQEPEFLPADLIQLVLKHIYFLRFFEGVRFRPLVHLIWNDPTANDSRLEICLTPMLEKNQSKSVILPLINLQKDNQQKCLNNDSIDCSIPVMHKQQYQ
jgi:hypothetical protein